jgi:hypothetical protein
MITMHSFKVGQPGAVVELDEADVLSLRAEASAAGDTLTVRDCDSAVSGDEDAMMRVARTIAYARMRSEES